MEIKRHNLVEITSIGREWAFAHLRPHPCLQGSGEDKLRELIVEGIDGKMIPGIMRREEGDVIPGTIPVGFASPYKVEGRRVRIPAFVPREEILQVITPYQVLEYEFPGRTESLQTLLEIKKKATEQGLRLGVLGSACLEIYTGLPYTDLNSDLDLLIPAVDYKQVAEYWRLFREVEKRHRCKMDLELELPSGYGIKMSELRMSTEEVLGKSLEDVKLIPKESILAMLGGNPVDLEF